METGVTYKTMYCVVIGIGETQKYYFETHDKAIKFQLKANRKFGHVYITTVLVLEHNGKYYPLNHVVPDERIILNNLNKVPDI